MKCLYIVPGGPITPNGFGGGSSIYYDQLMILRELGIELHLWHFASQTDRAKFDSFVRADPETWRRVQALCQTVTLTTTPDTLSLWERLVARAFWLLRPGPVRPGLQLLRIFRQLPSRREVDFIWAHHGDAVGLAIQQRTCPVVYAHHDWLYRIVALRCGRPESIQLRRIEEELARRVAVAVSGSRVELDELKQVGCPEVAYLPVTYDLAPLGQITDLPLRPKLVHLGGMGTTANREGLRRFLEVVWPELRDDRLELEVIGDITQAPEGLQAQLRSIRCLGFVPNLQTVLAPGDLHIIPWEFPTGQRTRVPLVFNYGQVIVATRAAVSCYPEVVDGVNGRLVQGLDQMAAVIRELASDPAQRLRLARGARDTFERCFSRPAVQVQYRSLLRFLAGKSHSLAPVTKTEVSPAI